MIQPRFWPLLLICALFTVLEHSKAAADAQHVTVITRDTVLDPNTNYGTLVIAASNITVDGSGVTLMGADVAPNLRSGIAITAQGQSDVTLKNIRAHRFETGLHVADGERWTIENCDFSDNFHDAAFGWGENGRRGGIVLERVHHSTLRNNRANRVWDACVLIESNDNSLELNDFSRTSNTCLKMWTASRNTITNNRLTHGIRIQPDEVHARDSTCVLIESGSNFNRFVENDCTYGGDGIFVRVLNGWCSTDNYFEKNDCSYANNNGFECWAPRNTFVGNRANHCSYGFWMGGSDQTRLIDNEASYNGLETGQHNSPHLPDRGHAGIVFMFGPSSHILARGNRCIGNNGAGIALIGDLDSQGKKWKAYHWLLERNELMENRWGIYAQYADWLLIAHNVFKDNSIEDVYTADGVSRSHFVPLDGQAAQTAGEIPRVMLEGPGAVRAGELIRFVCRATASEPSEYAWDLGDGTMANTQSVEHRYATPGFYRVGVNAKFSAGTELAYRDLVVVADQPELASDAAQWSFEPADNLMCKFTADNKHFVAGKSSIHAKLDPYHGSVARLLFPASREAGWSLKSKSSIGFWLKAINPNMPGWQSNNPEIVLFERTGKTLRLSPKRDLFSEPGQSEAREGWRYIEIPLAANAQWERTGDELSEVDYMTIGIDSWDSQPLQIWIDGLIIQ